MYDVIYFSRTGNTRKVALAIGEELGVGPRHIRWVGTLPDEDVIFLGSGLYFMRPARMVRDFIRNNDFRGRKIALFGTSNTGAGIEIMWMKWLLKRKGAVLIGEYYCAGKFSIRFAMPNAKWQLSARGGRPAESDIENARLFARMVAGKETALPDTDASAPPVPAGAASRGRTYDH